MDSHKKSVQELTTRGLLARRRVLARRLGDLEEVLTGSLVEQGRRCGKAGCRCVEGELHGPYAYLSSPGQSRLRYVPAAWVDVVAHCLARGSEVETVLAQISAINTELLARRELR